MVRTTILPDARPANTNLQKKKSNHFIAKRYSTGVAETLPFILREIERSYTASKGFVCVLQLKIIRREDFDFAVESTCYDIVAVSRDT